MVLLSRSFSDLTTSYIDQTLNCYLMCEVTTDRNVKYTGTGTGTVYFFVLLRHFVYLLAGLVVGLVG